MNKVSFLNNKWTDKSNIAVICILGMGIGMLTSVAILSVFTFLFGINSIIGIHPRLWLRSKWWLISVALFLTYAVTYFWSADKTQWEIHLQTKLPILILPLVARFLPAFTHRQLRQITICLSALMLTSACYSLYFILHDPEHYIKGYNFSHLLPTRPNDHIRISITMVLFIAWSLYTWPYLENRTAKWFTGCTIAIAVLFIHILAAKSGIISFYILLVGYGIYIAFSRNKIAGIALIILIPVCYEAAKLIPTFNARIAYTEYTFDMIRRGDKSVPLGDANRLMSYDVGMKLIKEHPLTGVGTGDMMTYMSEGYHELYPRVEAQDVLLPHNQFMIVALGCGIPAMLLFALWVFFPLRFLKKNRQSFFFFITWFILLLQLLIEPTLEVQMGVFVYLFFIVLQLHEVVKNDPGDLTTQLDN